MRLPSCAHEGRAAACYPGRSVGETKATGRQTATEGSCRLESRTDTPTLIAATSTANPRKNVPAPGAPAEAATPGAGADGPEGGKGRRGLSGVQPEEDRPPDEAPSGGVAEDRPGDWAADGRCRASTSGLIGMEPTTGASITTIEGRDGAAWGSRVVEPSANSCGTRTEGVTGAVVSVGSGTSAGGETSTGAGTSVAGLMSTGGGTSTGSGTSTGGETSTGAGTSVAGVMSTGGGTSTGGGASTGGASAEGGASGSVSVTGGGGSESPEGSVVTGESSAGPTSSNPDGSAPPSSVVSGSNVSPLSAVSPEASGASPSAPALAVSRHVSTHASVEVESDTS
jgi:hypothetical protein